MKWNKGYAEGHVSRRRTQLESDSTYGSKVYTNFDSAEWKAILRIEVQLERYNRKKRVSRESYEGFSICYYRGKHIYIHKCYILLSWCIVRKGTVLDRCELVYHTGVGKRFHRSATRIEWTWEKARKLLREGELKVRALWRAYIGV